MTPRENPELYGHEAAEAAIETALAGGRMHHAWLISGPEGVGKATLAYRFARRLLAGGAAPLRTPPDHPAFRRTAAGTHADLLTVEREWDEKKKRMKKTIAAETVRGIPPFLHLTPAEGGWRVVIVDGAEDMNIQSANAVLKVLEEPPPRALLMLVTAAPGRLLPTIRSRCRALHLPPLSSTAMDQALTLLLPDTPAEDRARLGALAAGAPGRAVTLAEQGGLAVAALVDELMTRAPLPPTRAYEMGDALRDELAFDLFFTLLQNRLAEAARASLRGTSTSRLPAAALADLWTRLGALRDDADRHNLDRRQAVVAGVGLFS